MRKPLLFFLLLAALAQPGFAQICEPDVNVAKAWWPEQYNVWTPLGWPDHYFKAAVLYNGTVVITPGMGYKPHSKEWLNEDFQLSFCASEDGHTWPMPKAAAILREWDGGLGVQHWDKGHETPVLHTEFRNKEGFVLETRMFAHIHGEGDVVSALEPEYLWIRVAVRHLDSYYHPQRFKMSVLLSRLFLRHANFRKLAPDISIEPWKAVCDKALKIESSTVSGLSGWNVVDNEGKVRMGVFPGEGTGIEFAKALSSCYNLTLDFPEKEGAYVDLLFPILVDDLPSFSSEAAQGYDSALAQADAYWQSLRPETEAVFDVPETFITDALRQNLKFARILGEKDHVTGNYSYISGVWMYDAFWPTPGSMLSAMFMDPMGHFSDTERYSEVFAKLQGERKAPGASYSIHPGYFSTPSYLMSVDWLTDHGAIMYQVASHALLTGDEKFIERWTEPLVKACDFIMQYSRSDHKGIKGLLPAGWSTDEEVPVQSIWNLAWNYKGLSEAIRVLRKAGHPRAEEFEAFRKEFIETFRREYRKAAENGPRWTDRNGALRFRPPGELSVEAPSRLQIKGRPVGFTHMTDAFYLDGGPLCLVWAGLLDADDPIMVDMLDFFREGPNWDLHKPFAWSCDRPVLEHEISSCEPCYSWNAYHSWQKGDRQHYLEAMYSVLVGSISQNTFISGEHRHGIQGNMFAFPFGFGLARLTVIDDQLDKGDLHLLRFCPLAWLRNDRPSSFLKMPTEFGPVNLTVQLSKDGKTLIVNFHGDWRERPGKITLHIPPVPGLKKVSVNGKSYPASKGVVQL